MYDETIRKREKKEKRNRWKKRIFSLYLFYFYIKTITVRSENCKVSRVKAINERENILLRSILAPSNFEVKSKKTKDWRNREGREERFRFSAR